MSKFKTLKDIYDDLDVHSMQALQYNDAKLALGRNALYKEYISKEDLIKALDKTISSFLMNKVLEELARART